MGFLRKLYLKWKISRMGPEQLRLAQEEGRAIQRKLDRIAYIIEKPAEIGEMLKKQGIDPEDVVGIDRYLKSVGI